MATIVSVPLAVLATVLLSAQPASAQAARRHPLGNFSVNQYLGLTLHPDRVEARVVVDYAEIPTLQNGDRVDTDGDGAVSEAERAARAATVCGEVAAAVDARVGGVRLVWKVLRSQLAYSPGGGGLDVSRLGCELSAPARLDAPATIVVTNRFLGDRVGWREMTATGVGVRLLDSALPGRSVSDELRSYPKDLLSSALDVRSATVRVEPGSGSDEPAAAGIRSGDDPVSRWMAAVDRRFQDIAGGDHLTPTVGLLAVLLALLLGAGHAALPGHGKTILAAYLAGQRGRPRDALAVAGTVTLTHTGGVLALGLLLTAGTAVAGEQIINVLGLASGAIVLAVGASMLAAVLRRRHHGDHAHHHGDAHQRPDTDGHEHRHGYGGDEHDHSHAHGHGHGPGGHAHGPGGHAHGGQAHAHGHRGHGHRHGWSQPGDRGRGRAWSGRVGLAGIGLAGGLVPSPSALVVLLAAIGLGRTGFGVLLVIIYGVGMAATLTGAGLLLLSVQRRLSRETADGGGRPRLARLVTRMRLVTPATTAALVMLVGMGLAARAAAAVW